MFAAALRRPPTLRALSRRAYSTLPEGTTRDPAHPHLYYHLTSPPPSPSPSSSSPPPAVLISFLPRAPVLGSATVLGALPAAPGVGLAQFVENPRFRDLLHSSIKKAIEEGKATSVEYEAATRPGDGYMHIVDERNIPPPGRVGDPDDLIASVFVQDGKAVPSTYEPLPTYRLVTGEGVLTLPPGLDEFVVQEFEKVDREERGEQ